MFYHKVTAKLYIFCKHDKVNEYEYLSVFEKYIML